MSIHTQFEDLSNEIFFEIFDYLDALDIFTGFYSLNQRISSILQSIPLQVVIPCNHHRSQIECLSSYLTFHAHQVISLKIHDTIHDDTSIVSLLFDRHQFINLQSCVFHRIEPSTKLENVIKQLKNSNTLVSFAIYQTFNGTLSENDLIPTMLMHKSSCIHSINLQLPYDYLDISNYSSISYNITSLHLFIYGSPASVSVYSVLPIFRLCRSIRHLGIIISYIDPIDKQDQSIPIPTLPVNEDDLPILLKLISFDFTIFAKCDGESLSYILRCMPNLKYFYFNFEMPCLRWLFPGELIDGHVWRTMFERFVPRLSKFEFHMVIVKGRPKLNLHTIVNSFIYFTRKFTDWHMTIDRWEYGQFGGEYIILRTLNYHKLKSSDYVMLPCVNSETFETLSTTTEDHYVFYSDLKRLPVYISERPPVVTWPSSLYHHVDHLLIEIPKISSIWNSLLTIVRLNETSDRDAQQTVTNLSHFVHLGNVTCIEFISAVDISQWKHIQFILQACPNVNDLTINTPLLFYSKLIDNPSLISIFKQIKTLELQTRNLYFHPNFASKVSQQFPALKTIELEVFSFDDCLDIIDVFLTQMENLSHIKIKYQQATAFDHPISPNYVVEKRREKFPGHVIDGKMANLKKTKKDVQIWLP